MGISQLKVYSNILTSDLVSPLLAPPIGVNFLSGLYYISLSADSEICLVLNPVKYSLSTITAVPCALLYCSIGVKFVGPSRILTKFTTRQGYQLSKLFTQD